jgi:RNA polymerase sigma factor (sigma-70 family)
MATVAPLLAPTSPWRGSWQEVVQVSDDGYASDEYELAFSRLYDRAYGVAYKLLGSRGEAEDIAQEALARAYLSWPKVHPYAEAWTVRVAGNLSIGSWRKSRRLVAMADPELATPVAGDLGPPAADDDSVGSAAAALASDHLELRRALAMLSKRQREVVVLRHLAGFSERETAETLGCSTGSVKQHSSRGLAALRTQLAGRISRDEAMMATDGSADGAGGPSGTGGTGGAGGVGGTSGTAATPAADAGRS